MNELSYQKNQEIADLIFEKLDVRQSTIKDYKYRIGHFLYFMQNTPLSPDLLVQYKNYLRLTAEMKVSTKNKFLTCARIFLREVQRQPRAPFQFNLDVKSFQQSKKHKVYGLNEYDVSLLCGWINRNPEKLREHAILCLLLFQGLRQFEICNIKWHEVDVEEGTVLIQGKGMDDKEIVHLHPQTVRALDRYIKQRKQTMHPQEGYLFVSKSKRGAEERLTVRGLRYIVKDIFEGLGIDRTVHGTRHYFTTHLIKNMPGSNLLQIAQFTRHRSTETLQTYYDAILEEDDLADYQNAFNDVASKLVVEPAK
jgi:integrase/recombinase XerC